MGVGPGLELLLGSSELLLGASELEDGSSLELDGAKELEEGSSAELLLGSSLELDGSIIDEDLLLLPPPQPTRVVAVNNVTRNKA